jgi:cytochrome c551/c552
VERSGTRVALSARMRPIAIVTLFLCVACGDRGKESKTVVIPGEARAEATSIFSGRCVPCHGTSGNGDGPASASLNPKPRRFADGAWQKSVTDEHLEKIIQYGGAAVGKSAAMPANPDLQSKPFVVKALVEQVRAFGGR